MPVQDGVERVALINIVVDRSLRQRTDIDTTGLKESLAEIGLLNPIILRRVNGTNVLVAGERRLKAAKELGWIDIPSRYFETLDPLEAKVIELEENLKRKDLSWRDLARGIGEIHSLRVKQDPTWSKPKTAKSLSIPTAQLYKILAVFENLSSPRLEGASSIDNAYNIIDRQAERHAESVVSKILSQGAEIFAAEAPPPPPTSTLAEGETSLPPLSPTSREAPIKQEVQPPIICANFIDWAKTYTGPKFNFLHCDFPYGVYHGGNFGTDSIETDKTLYENTQEIYWKLLQALNDNVERIASYSAHMMFWFSMNFYQETKDLLTKAGWAVQNHPLIWHKTDGRGIAPALNIYPKRTYDTALLCSRGNRPLVKQGANSYGGPGVTSLIHPSQKPEPMLQYFMAMLVDETTTVFDPTAGSGSALRAAEACGAKYILGLELDPGHAAEANTATLRARTLREMGKFI